MTCDHRRHGLYQCVSSPRNRVHPCVPVPTGLGTQMAGTPECRLRGPAGQGYGMVRLPTGVCPSLPRLIGRADSDILAGVGLWGNCWGSLDFGS